MLMDESASDFEEKETKSVGVTFPQRLRFHGTHQIGEADEFREHDGREKLKCQLLLFLDSSSVSTLFLAFVGFAVK